MPLSRMMVDVGGEKGTIATEEKEMINNVFEFNNRAVSEIIATCSQYFIPILLGTSSPKIIVKYDKIIVIKKIT